METGLATILAAGISAFAVAVTFLAGELIRLSRNHSARRAEGIGRLIAATSEVPRLVITATTSTLLLSRARHRAEAATVISAMLVAGTGLYGFLPRRDFWLADWVCWRLERLSMTDTALIQTSAEIQAMLTVYLIAPRRARASVRRSGADYSSWREHIFRGELPDAD